MVHVTSLKAAILACFIATAVNGQAERCSSSGFTTISNFYLEGTKLGDVLAATSTTVCMEACMNTNSCTGYLYSQADTCQLFQGVTSLFDFFVDLAFNSGSACDPTATLELQELECLSPGFSIAGGKEIIGVGQTLGPVVVAATTAVCQQLCIADSRCTGFNYYPDSTCQLFLGPTTDFVFTFNDAVNAGYACSLENDFSVQSIECGNDGFVNLSDFDLNGELLGSRVVAANTPICRNLCTADPSCSGYLYFDDSTCQLYQGSVTNFNFGINNSTNAGYTCTPPSFSLERFICNEFGFELNSDLTITGFDLGPLANAVNTPACQSLCSNTVGCTGFTYFSNMTCQLKRLDPAGFPFVTADGSTSGYACGAERVAF